MARQIKTETPSQEEIRAIIAQAQALRSQVLAAAFHRGVRRLGQIWSWTGLRSRPAH